MAEKQSNKDRLKEITDSIESGIKELFESDKYRKYLATMSRFHRYSVNNTMLIFMQRPDATHVAGFNKWRDQFGRNVMKGEKGIKIIAPTPFKKKIEEAKLDPDTRLPMLDAEGNAIMEEKEIRIPMYKPVTVFDVAQTEGKPLPSLASDLSGNVQNYEVFWEALKRSAPVPVQLESMEAGMDGYFDPEHQRIAIRTGMSEVQTVCAAVHEIAHSKLHNYAKAQEQAAAGDESAKPAKKKDRNTEEVEAESISFAVCAYYGIETGENSFGYIAGWSQGKELPELRASLETINKASSGLITDIDRHYAEICKERGLDMTAEQDTPAESLTASVAQESAPVPPADAPTASIPDTAPITEITVQEPEPVSAPDNGCVPDPAISEGSMNAYGYTDAGMLPLTKERALELMERDVTVYMLHSDNTEAMAFDAEEIQDFEGIFGIAVEDWKAIQDTPVTVVQRPDYEKAFLDSSGDAYAVYQLRRGDENAELRFMNMDYLDKKGYSVEHERYEAVYAGALEYAGDTHDKLNGLYTTFNINHPADFTGHSLSVSDIVALKQNGVVSCHYVDSWGFKELPGFLPVENYLKAAELSTEDDYGMIDGIINNGKQATVAELEQQAKSGQPISLLALAEAVHREEQEKRSSSMEPAKGKPSVLSRLRAPAATKPTNTAPKKSAEREL